MTGRARVRLGLTVVAGLAGGAVAGGGVGAGWYGPGVGVGLAVLIGGAVGVVVFRTRLGARPDARTRRRATRDRPR